MIPESKQGGYPWDVWETAMEAEVDIRKEVDHPTDIIAQAILKVLASRLTRQEDEIRKAALEEAAEDALDRLYEAAHGCLEIGVSGMSWLHGQGCRTQAERAAIRALSQKGDEADG